MAKAKTGQICGHQCVLDPGEWRHLEYDSNPLELSMVNSHT